MSRRPAARALLRIVAAASGSSLVVVALAAGLTLGSAVATTAATGALSDVLREAVAASPPAQRDLTATTRAVPSRGTSAGGAARGFPPDVDRAWGRLYDGLDLAGETRDPLAKQVTGDPHAMLRLDPARAQPAEGSAGVPDSQVILSFDPELPERVDVVEGTLPGAIEPGEPIPFAVTETVAEQFGWSVGEVRSVHYALGERPLVLSGILRVRDDADPAWGHALSALQASVVEHVDSAPTFVGTGYADAASIGDLRDLSAVVTLEVWYPVEVDALQASTASEVATSLRAFAAAPHTLDVMNAIGDEQWLMSPVGTTPTIIAATAPELAALGSLLAAVAAGVVLAAAAVLVLAVRSLVTRRRTLLALVSARGASDGARTAVLAAESALLAGVGVVAGSGIAAALGAPPQPLSVALALAWIALAAAAAGVTGALLVRAGVREDDRSRQRGPFRTGFDAAVAVLAVAAAAIVLTSPPATGSASVVAQILPALLVALGCSVALRITPAALRAAVGAGRRARGLVALLGPSRAARDRSAGAVPVLALVSGVAIAVLGTGLLATVTEGIDEAVSVQVGADVRVDALYVGASTVEEVAQVDGVVDIAVISSDRDLAASFPDGDGWITVYSADPAALAAVSSSVPVLPPGQAVVSQSVADRLADRPLVVAGTELEIAEVVPDGGAFGRSTSWIAVPPDVAETLGARLTPTALLVAVDPAADPEQVRAEIARLVDAIGTARTPDSVVALRTQAPAVQALSAGLAAAVIASAVLTVLAALLALGLAAPSRARVFALLRAIGSPARSEYGLVLWELGPALVVAVPVGIAVGVLLVPLLASAVDLAAFTGGSAEPTVQFGVASAALVVGLLVAAVALAVLVAAALARRFGAARAVRMIDEEG